MKPAALRACLGALTLVLAGQSAEVAKAPVPKSPYIAVVYRYADTMLAQGRDTYGPLQTGLFLSALDRATVAPLTNRPAAPAGIREGDRVGASGGALVGANLHHDENLLRLLYTLSELSAKPKYREGADTALQWFLQNKAAPFPHLLPWGEHLSWDVMKDEPISAHGTKGTKQAEFFRPWMLGDRCFELAPAASMQFALGLWDHQIANQASGAFDRRASFPAVSDKMDFPRQAGFYIRTWAAAYAHTKHEPFLKAIEVFLGRLQRHPVTGFIEVYAGHSNSWNASTLSLAIDCDGAAHRVPEPLASTLRAFTAREDEIFCSLPHDLKHTGGFVSAVDVATGKADDRHTPRWNARYGARTTAQVGLMCVSRYDNTGKLGYRELIYAAADSYATSLPGESEDAWPGTFGQAISLQLAAWRHSAKAAYLDRARTLADLAVEKFWGTNALPQASFKTAHYETITGADTLALALIELHLHVLHITAVRCPPNTIDR